MILFRLQHKPPDSIVTKQQYNIFKLTDNINNHRHNLRQYRVWE